jgi:hypothetical protein
VGETIGCTELEGILRTAIAEPLENPESYEISEGGRGIVTRFLHLNGCKRNSVTTCLRSFCQTKDLNFFDFSNFGELNPAVDFRQVFHLARRMQPALVCIANFDEHLVQQPQNSIAITALARECKKLFANRYAIWVVLRTNIVNFANYNPLHWDFYEYFTHNYIALPLQTDADVCVILANRLAHYLPELTFPGDAVVAFAHAYARHCTYLQIDAFVRRVINDARRKLTTAQRLVTPSPPITLLTLSQAVHSVTLPTRSVIQSILPFAPLHQNFEQYRAWAHDQARGHANKRVEHAFGVRIDDEQANSSINGKYPE